MFIFVIVLFVSGYAGSNIVCPNNWISYGNSCYQISTFNATWFFAAKNCSDAGGHLASIETSQENTFLKNTLNRLHAHEINPNHYWTSGNDLAKDGNWYWGFPNGEAFTFTDWYPGEPNNINSGHCQDVKNPEECMFLHGNLKFTWGDVRCTEDMFFICELQDSHTDVIVG